MIAVAVAGAVITLAGMLLAGFVLWTDGVIDD